MNLRRKLQNPFFLVSQGFLAGAVLFFAVSHQSGEARSSSSMADSRLVIETAHSQ